MPADEGAVESVSGDLRVRQHPVLGDLPPTTEVTIYVDDRPIPARAGEPIAAALLAAGIRVCRTMPNRGRPRGPFCGVGRCTDCLMTVDGEPSVRTCVTPVRDGQRIVTQRGLGSWEEGTA
ncbi:(2Fe-2S)-binding protein [Sphaerobacter sp.]|uniref:(2Fe-2S)-binding protein n=1 Tax=Sphaerobacter sp. TaxID=2099654 RepID=UPI001E0E605C|nr:(2Fe-2S)-binding protein [Sphaerobacter sp.]MBX5445388.1 (2Fe-2S)-binding protein [Sphaerobacter sp.]